MPLTAASSPQPAAARTSSVFLRTPTFPSKTTSLPPHLNLKLIRHCLRCWSGRRPRNPVGPCASIKVEPERVLPGQAHQKADRSKNQKEQQSCDDRTNHFVQQKPKSGPQPVEWTKQGRTHQRYKQKCSTQSQRPNPTRPPSSHRPQTNCHQNNGENQTKHAVG